MLFNLHRRAFAQPETLPFEVVERKGLGHPDTLCDAIAEKTSTLYNKYCLENFGRAAHHWFDKVILLGGESLVEFSRGEMQRPYKLLLIGKAALAVGATKIPLDEIFRAAAAAVLTSTLRNFDPARHLETEVLISDFRGPGQKPSRYRPASLTDLISTDDRKRVSNDCNLCVGFAPFSTLENIVLATEQHLNSVEFRERNIDTGSDIKVVGMRHGSALSLTVNLPFIADHIPSRAHYLKRLDEMTAYTRDYITTKFDAEVSVTLNPESSSGRSYLTVTGSVADTGDVGVVGRGNRSTGLITPMRPMTIEAAAGKNPLDHTGKIYSVIASELATRLSSDYSSPSTVFITTFKEAPLEDPASVEIFLDLPQQHPGTKVEKMTRELLADAYKLNQQSAASPLVLW